MNKIEQEELDQLNTAYEEVVDLKMRLADITVQQSRTIAKLTEKNEALGEIQGKLHAKYGKINVDLATGEIK
jgi:hypothetical protein